MAAELVNQAETVKESKYLLEVKGLKKWFPIKTGLFSKAQLFVKAVDGVDFYLSKGETLGVVGESGCGKSTMGRSLLRLIEPTEGEVYLDGVDITKLDKNAMRMTQRDMQIIFQDPYASLNPRMTVGDIIREPLDIQRLISKKDKEKRVRELMDTVGLPLRYMKRYPHEFSGGQRQRIGIARSLALNPKLIVCDEPVSALDVSIQAQIINLMQELQNELGMAYIFIAHDLSVVKHISQRVAVMYLGKIVEISDKKHLYDNPLHPYTKALLSAIPIPDPNLDREKILLHGDLPSPANPPSGCRFHTRCPLAKEICSQEVPAFEDKGDGHFCACHFVEKM